MAASLSLPLSLLLLCALPTALSSRLMWTYPEAVYDPTLVRHLALGNVMGAPCEKYRSTLHFLGIPFALPPVGDLRFRPPQKYDIPHPSPAYMAVQNAPICSSLCLDGTTIAISNDFSAEDCLYLNVWAPKEMPEILLPVRAYIHGGQFICSSVDPHSDGCSAVAKTDTLQVTFEFRKGPMGTLVHPGTMAESNVTGNWALLDQQLALKWIQENIAAFGGDPSRVLLFGNSAGAQAVELHQVAPGSAGLFHSAISESPPCVFLANLEQSYAYTSQFLPRVGCDGLKDSAAELECLRALPWNVLSNITESMLGFYNVPLNACSFRDRFEIFDYVVDGVTIPQQVHDALEQGKFHKVPFMVGTTVDEQANMVNSTFGMDNLAHETVVEALRTIYPGTEVERVLEAYPDSFFATDPQPEYARFVQIISDIQFNCPVYSRLLARAKYLSEAPTWVYKWGATPSCPPEFVELRARHTAELYFVFGIMPTTDFPSGECTFTPVEVELSHIVLTAWTSMARHGTPAWANGTVWAPWDSDLQRATFLDKGYTSIVATDRVQARCQVLLDQSIMARLTQPGLIDMGTGEA